MMGMQGAGERQTERLAFGAKMEQDRFGASAHWMAGIGTVALAVAGALWTMAAQAATDAAVSAGEASLSSVPVEVRAGYPASGPLHGRPDRQTGGQAGQPHAAAMGAVVVTATREAQPLADSVSDVVLIDGDRLHASGLHSVEDALQRYAGLQLARNGGPGQSAGYFLRGVGASGVVVLVDGVRVGSATLGQTQFGAMDLAQLERIEVVRGPASGLYGADAVGGVINLITRRGQGAPKLSAHLAVGGYGGRQAGADISGAAATGLGQLDYAVSVGREQNRSESALRPDDPNGYYNPDRDGFRRTVGTVNLGLTPVAGHRMGLVAAQSKLNAQYDSATWDAATGQSNALQDFRNRLTTRTAALDYRGKMSDRWTTSLQLGAAEDDAKSGAASPDRYRTVRRQFIWQNALQLQPGQQLVLGWEYLHEKVTAASYATTGVNGEGAQPDHRRRHNQGLLAGYTGQFGTGTDVQASVRYDHNSAYGNNTTGSLGATQALTQKLKLRAQVGTSFRAPTFNDLYFPNYGVSSLKPEKGRSAELGLLWQAPGTRASVTAYRNKVRNLIGYDPDTTGTTCPAGYFGCAANTDRATLKGATFQTMHDWQRVRLSAEFDFLDAKDDATGKRLNRRAAHQHSVAADYLGAGWTAGATLTRVGARPDGTVRLGSYAVLDLRARWEVDPRWTLEASLLNAADKDVEPVRGYQGLGRQFWLGARVNLAL